MIYEHVGGLTRARILCDGCEQPIHDYHQGIVLIEEPAIGQDVDQTRAKISHKNLGCQAKVRGSLGHEHWNGMSEELGNYLVMIALDVGMYSANFKERFNLLRRLGVVGAPPADEAEACETEKS